MGAIAVTKQIVKDVRTKLNENRVPESEIESVEDRIRYMGASWAVEEQKNKDKEDADVKYGIRNFDKLLNTFAENEKLNSADDN